MKRKDKILLLFVRGTSLSKAFESIDLQVYHDISLEQ